MEVTSASFKRKFKAALNLFADVPPRDKTLCIKDIRLTETGLGLDYEAKGRVFTTSVFLPDDLVSKLAKADRAELAPTLLAIALAFAPFFFKISDFKKVELTAFPLDSASADFFSKFFQGGLGEFRYLQGLDPTRRVEVEPVHLNQPSPVAIKTEDHLLMLNGGGKDTIVAGELLRLAGQRFTWVTIRPNAARRSVVELSENPNSVEIGYDFDTNVERLKAYPWGHFPHTSVVLSLGLLTAQLLGARYVCAGNEHSSNYGNLVYEGFPVNHQYTKSFEYEQGFSDYVRRCVTPDIKVFSILRPFHDLQLSKLFASLPRYQKSFISCNRAITRNQWCKECPKCAFTAIALYPYVGSDGMVNIFGEDILQRPAIREHIVDLTTARTKPWECVGTQEECKLALKLLLDRNPSLEFSQNPSRKTLEDIVRDVDVTREETRLLHTAVSEHAIPEEIVAKLNHALNRMGERVTIPLPGI